MAGHSHWSNIQHKKAAKDKKKGKVLSKLIKQLHTAVREGGGSGDPDANPRLRLILEKCRLANMPKDNIKRAIEKATLGSTGYEELMFEGYGPAGVALIVECLSDNPQRTGPEIRYIFDRNGAKIGKSGSVAHMFARTGVFHIEKSKAPEEKLVEIALDAGAGDITEQDDFFEVTCDPTQYLAVAAAFAAAGIEAGLSEIQMLPASRVEVDLETARKLSRLIEVIEDHEDVQNVYANFDVSAEAAETLAREA